MTLEHQVYSLYNYLNTNYPMRYLLNQIAIVATKNSEAEHAKCILQILNIHEGETIISWEADII